MDNAIAELCRSVVFLALFSLTVALTFFVGGYQRLLDSSMNIILCVLSISTAILAILCIPLCILSIIAAIHKKRLRYIGLFAVSAITGITATVVLFICITVRLASGGL